MDKWRRIDDEPGGGAWNMAVDEGLLVSAADDGQPSLRFYQWSEPTVSLGYFQRSADRTRHTPSLGCHAVRRATGGGAIVHDHDLTYSLVLPLGDRWSAAATGLYRQAHTALVTALAAWGVKAFLRSGGDAATDRDPFLCFLRQARGDVIAGRVKIAGSAQRRAKRAILQHGSVLLHRSASAPELPGIEELTGVRIDGRELANRWSTALSEQLGVQWVPTALGRTERDRARLLVQQRFGRVDWTHRR
jgi:lipoate-protein ligase A